MMPKPRDQDDGEDHSDDVDDQGDEDEVDDVRDTEEHQNAQSQSVPAFLQRKRKRNLLTPESLEEFNRKESQKGVVYISRIPAHMKPLKIRHLLSQYGEIGRIFLTPEDESKRRRRIQKGGNRKKNFTDGWVEFIDKRVAKHVAFSLNNTTMGGNKRSFYHDCIWNIKYLSGFKWHHLNAKLSYENAVRDQRLKAEISQAKRERDFYLTQVDKATRAAKAVKRKGGGEAHAAAASGTKPKGTNTSSGDGAAEQVEPSAKRMRTFKQKPSRAETASLDSGKTTSWVDKLFLSSSRKASVPR